MIRNRIVLKSFAVFFLLEILSSTVIPSISYALTSGPTAPEATSFEPVDTTDMVNTSTGDFTYNLPLLEVPGPAGGYPLALSYHAGIQPDLEASWVGLGWSLNPGSLTRLTNGYADDMRGPNIVNRMFWEGGETTTYTAGVSFGIANAGTVSAGLSFAQDTYKGFGMGGYVAASAGYMIGGVSGQVGIQPYGGLSASGGVSVGISKTIGALQGSASYGTQWSTESGRSSGAQYQGKMFFPNGMISISSNGNLKASIKGVGVSGGSFNSKNGSTTVTGNEFTVDIPLGAVNLRLGRSYVRYWVDELDGTQVYGSLYHPTLTSDQVTNPFFDNYFDSRTFDAYHIQDNVDSFIDKKRTDEVLGGSFADYDQYSVNAQGVGGTIKPYHYRLTLAKQNIKKDGQPYDIKNYNDVQHYDGDGSSNVEFRFVNDFSNKVQYEPPMIQKGVSSSDPTPLEFNKGTPSVDKTNINTLPRVPGSRYIEFFTNEEILSSTGLAKNKGFIDCKALGFKRSDLNVNADDVSNPDDPRNLPNPDYNLPPNAYGSIGGFMITNTSGVTYHFSLPAYSFEEYTYSGNIRHPDGKTFNTLRQPTKYAYTWYLTAITGPDFVDRNSDGLANEGDWGYWVTMEYGKWTDKFRWRNPGTGFNDDIDQNFRNFAKGIKEVYYLNKIQTASHTALFVKEIRADGKSSNPSFDDAVKTSGGDIQAIDEGIFEEEIFANGRHAPVSLLRLHSIHIFANEDIKPAGAVARLGNGYEHSEINQQTSNIRWSVYGKNVVDVTDFSALASPIASKSIRSIQFNTDYSLCPSTPNSYLSSVDNLLTGVSADVTKQGKLTLNSLTFKGHGGIQSLLPDLQFTYEMDDHELKNITPVSVSVSSNQVTLDPSVYPHLQNYRIGDIVVLTQTASTPNDYKTYGYVKTKSLTSIGIVTLTTPMNASINSMRRTKNPKYSKDFSDLWGSYKVDYKNFGTANISKQTTQISASSADAWCLRKIKMQTGADISISYEPDNYSKSGYEGSRSWPISSFSSYIDLTQQGDIKTSFEVKAIVNIPSVDLNEYYAANEDVDVYIQFNVCDNPPFCNTLKLTKAKILHVAPNYLRLKFELDFKLAPSTTIDILGFYGGNIFLNPQKNRFGGGIRVKSVSILDKSTMKGRSTNYDYEFLNDGVLLSSGVTSFEPFVLDKIITNGNESVSDYKQFQKDIFAKYIDLLTLGRFIPPPGVIYGKVRVHESIIDYSSNMTSRTLPGSTEYTYYTFDKNLIGRFDSSSEPNVSQSGDAQGLHYTSISTRKTAIKDYTSRVGSVKSIAYYNEAGHKISETINHYLHDELTGQTKEENVIQYDQLLGRFSQQGVIHETFNHARFIKQKENNNYDLLGIISKNEVYPTIQTGSTTTNLKTGIRTVSKNVSFDFYSGEVVETLSSDGYGNHFLSQVVPAYTVYNKMGPRNRSSEGFDIFRKHMLIQPAAEYVYRVNPENLNKLSLVSGSVTTWSETIPVLNATFADMAKGIDNDHMVGIWRKGVNYSFVGDPGQELTGNGFIGTLHPFDFNEGATNSKWQKESEVTRYNVFSNALEATDINNKFVATKMSQNQFRVAATVANSSYKEFAYSGAEDTPSASREIGGGVYYDGSIVPQAHTGAKGIQSSPGIKAFKYSFDPETKKYHVSVWSSLPTGKIMYKVGTGSPQIATLLSNKRSGTSNWYQLEADIQADGSATELEIWCEAESAVTVFDDFRVHPVDAAMMSYVYNSYGELSHILDANNLYTEYVYDIMGRLKEVKRESFTYGTVKVSEHIYHYANQ